MESKVSIIVPFYNAEKYFRQCLDSIVGQSYSNLEIILVNDGATDSCVLIANEYAVNDKRLVIVNQINAGVSSARNTGLDAATGLYVMFVDSDDVIDTEAVQILYESMEKNDLDIAIAGFTTFHEQIINGDSTETGVIEYFSRHQLLSELAECGRIQNFAWGKLYKRDLFDGISFPIGKVFEDISTIYKVFDRCEKGCFISNKLFFYRQNSDSLSKKMNIQKMNDYCIALCEKAEFYLNSYQEIVPLLSRSFFDCAALAIMCCDSSQIDSFNRFMMIYKTIVKNASIKNRIYFFLCSHPRLLKMLSKSMRGK